MIRHDATYRLTALSPSACTVVKCAAAAVPPVAAAVTMIGSNAVQRGVAVIMRELRG